MIDESKKYYVYLHCRASNGSVFYVGKGQGNRAWNEFNRNKYWRHVVSKNGYTVKIVMTFHNEECSFSFEKALIRYYGRSNLCNMTDGGEGMSGNYPSEETREKLRIAARSKPKESYEKMAAAHRGMKRSEEARKRMSLAAIKRGPTRTGAVLSEETKEKIRKSRAFTTVYKFVNKYTLEGFEGIQSDLCRKYGLSRGNVAKLVKGEIHHNKGWTVLCVVNNELN